MTQAQKPTPLPGSGGPGPHPPLASPDCPDSKGRSSRTVGRGDWCSTPLSMHLPVSAGSACHSALARRQPSTFPTAASVPFTQSRLEENTCPGPTPANTWPPPEDRAGSRGLVSLGRLPWGLPSTLSSTRQLIKGALTGLAGPRGRGAASQNKQMHRADSPAGPSPSTGPTAGLPRQVSEAEDLGTWGAKPRPAGDGAWGGGGHLGLVHSASTRSLLALGPTPITSAPRDSLCSPPVGSQLDQGSPPALPPCPRASPSPPQAACRLTTQVPLSSVGEGAADHVCWLTAVLPKRRSRHLCKQLGVGVGGAPDTSWRSCRPPGDSGTPACGTEPAPHPSSQGARPTVAWPWPLHAGHVSPESCTHCMAASCARPRGGGDSQRP